MSGTATGADGDTDTHPTNNYDHHLEQDHEREEEGSGSHDQNNQPSTGKSIRIYLDAQVNHDLGNCFVFFYKTGQFYIGQFVADRHNS